MTLDETADDPAFDDPKILYFSELWIDHSKRLSGTTKNSFAHAFLKHVIGADDNYITAFIKGDIRAEQYIGLRQAGQETRKEDFQNFWQDIIAITPRDYTPQDLYWLIENTTFPAVIGFLAVMQIGGSPQPHHSSDLISLIQSNHFKYGFFNGLHF